MRQVVITVFVLALAAIAIIGFTVTASRSRSSSVRSPQAITAPTAPTAAVLRAQGRTRESEIHLKELKCEGDLIGKTTASDAHEFCHGLRLSDWEEWALQYPELAKAREAVAR
jgi:hypothetical protein